MRHRHPLRHRQTLLFLVALATEGLACHGSTEPSGEGGGAVLWQVAGGSQAAPAVADSTVYFATTDHAITALDTRTGVPRWKTATGESGFPYGRNVLVVGPLVIDPDYSVYAFDRVTGALRWRFSPTNGDSPGRFIISTDGTRVYLGSAAGYAYAVDAGTGALVWTTAIAVDGNSVVTNPVIDRGTVFVSLRHYTNPQTGGIVALDALTGAIRWQRNFVPTAPGQGAGTVMRVGIWHNLVIASSDDGAVYGLDRSTGAIVWVSPRPPDEGALNDGRPIAVVGDVAVVGSDRAVLTGLDAATGQQRWTIPSRFGGVNYELGSDERFAYLTYSGLQLSAIDPAGSIAWTSGGAGTGNYTPYGVSDGVRVYAPGQNGLYAIQR